MKILKYGEITFREGQGPDVHGWDVMREDSDPPDATNEQLLLGFAIHWAQKKFQVAMNQAVMDIFASRVRKIKAEGGCLCTNAITHDDPKHLRTKCSNVPLEN